MRCYTVEDDRAPFLGITIDRNGNTGVTGQFCSVSSVSRPKLMSRWPAWYHRPETGISNIIDSAGVITLGDNTYPLLVESKADEDPRAVLVYWFLNESIEPGFGKYQGIDRSLGTVVHAFTGLHHPYCEMILTLPKDGYLTLTRDRGHLLNLHWDGVKLYLTR